MKHSRGFAAVTAVFATIAFLALGGCGGGEPALQAALEEVDGLVRVARADGEVLEAEVDMELWNGDQVVTMEDGSATVTFMDDHLVKIAGNTTFLVQEIEPATVASALMASVQVLAGRISVSLGQLSGREAGFVVYTPTTVAAVKGTTLGVEVADGETTVSVLEGVVETAAIDEEGRRGERVEVRAGCETKVRARMRERLQVRRMERARRAVVEERLKALREHARRFRKMRRRGDLAKIRRVRALAREDRLDEADPRIKKFLRKNPQLKERAIQHGQRHRELRKDGVQPTDRNRTARPGQPGARDAQGGRVQRVTRPGQKAVPKKAATPQKQAPAQGKSPRQTAPNRPQPQR